MTETTLPGLTRTGRWGLLAVALVLMLSFEGQADPQDALKKAPGGLPNGTGQQVGIDDVLEFNPTVEEFVHFDVHRSAV